MQRFASKALFKAFDGIGDDYLESKTMTNLITNAQKKVEGQNFDTRKSLLDYDDVLSKQRQIMYAKRDEILYSKSIEQDIPEYFKRCIESSINSCLKQEDGETVVDGNKLYKVLVPRYIPENRIKAEDIDSLPKDEVEDYLLTLLNHDYRKRRASWSDELANYVEKTVVLQMTDRSWTQHIDQMSKLREAIFLRSYANTNPLQSYTNEGYDMFNKMQDKIAENITNALFRVQVRQQPSSSQVSANPIPTPNKEVPSNTPIKPAPNQEIKPHQVFPGEEANKD